MKNLRNKNQPPPETAIQTFLSSSWDKVLAVYAKLAEIEILADTITAGDLDGILTETDIDTIAKLNAILTDAELGDFATQAEAEAGVSNTKTMTPLRVAQAIAVLAAGIQNNFAAVTDPTVTDDSAAGYAVGSVWINTALVPPETYRCADPSVGAAVWVKTSLTSDELAVVGLTGNSDDLIEGVVNLLLTVAERAKLGGIEAGATADQSNAEIEAGYNAQVPVVSQLEAEAGALTDVRRWTPQRVAQAIAALASGGLAWSSANSSIPVVKNTGTMFYALGATVTATLPASPAVGDSLMIVNNDSNPADAYFVTINAGGSNELICQNVTVTPSWNLAQGHTALLVCRDAGATKRWHITVWNSVINPTSGGGGLTPIFLDISDSPYTASAGESLFCDSTGGPITIELPAGANQDNIKVFDAAGVCSVNAITINPDGAETIGNDTSFVIDQNWGQVELAYEDLDSDWVIAPIGYPDLISANTVFIVYKNISYTANAGERVMVDTTLGPLTITLPATPTAGDAVGVWDASAYADVQNITIARNGSTIMGAAADDTLDIASGHFEYVFNGTTWKRSFWAPGGLQLADVVGVETYFIRPYDMNSSFASRGATVGSYQAPTLDFDQAAYENGSFVLGMPNRWDEGQFRFRLTWQPSTTNTGVVQWGVYGNAANDSVAMPTSSVGASVDDAGSGVADAWQRTAWSSWFSIDNTPTYDKLIALRVQRNGGAGSDTYTADARFICLELQWRSNAATDD